MGNYEERTGKSHKIYGCAERVLTTSEKHYHQLLHLHMYIRILVARGQVYPQQERNITVPMCESEQSPQAASRHITVLVSTYLTAAKVHVQWSSQGTCIYNGDVLVAISTTVHATHMPNACMYAYIMHACMHILCMHVCIYYT